MATATTVVVGDFVQFVHGGYMRVGTVLDVTDYIVTVISGGDQIELPIDSKLMVKVLTF